MTPCIVLALAGCAAQPPTADALLARLNLDQRIALLHGTPEPAAANEGEAGFLPGLPEAGIGPLRFADGPPGVLTRYPATALTGTLGLAATFSVEDAREAGRVIARDARAAGIAVTLQPFINLERDPTFFRAYDTFGEDPLLTGAIGAAEIAGIQSLGVMAMAKHYIGYDGSADVRVDDRTLHEIYLAPFEAAVDAGVASIMCSYSVVNGEYACGNHDTLTRILRQEMGFKGFVCSDWGAMHGTGFINAGLDLEMPGSGSTIASYLAGTPPVIDHADIELAPPVINSTPEETPPAPVLVPTLPGTPPIGLRAALARGMVSEATINEAARRVLRELVRFGHVGDPGKAPFDAGTEGVESPEALAETTRVVHRTALDAAVLLKNEGGALPLDARDLSSLALIGPGALQGIAAGISGEKGLGRVERETGPLAALRSLGGADARITPVPADDMNGETIPGSQLRHEGLPGLLRRDAGGRILGIDDRLDFTLARGTALPAGSNLEWQGVLQVPASGHYRLYLQMLGAQGSLAIDGRTIARTGYLSLHGDVLQPGQDNVLPSLDGLDNVRREIDLPAGPHALLLQSRGEPRGAPVQVRLAWVTPAQRAIDYAAAVQAARSARKAIVFAWSRGQPAMRLPGDQDRLIEDVAAANPQTVVVLNVAEPVAMPWLDRVRAVLLMWYPGDEGGPATAELLAGRASPGGRLPFTWPRRIEDGVASDPAHPERSSAGIEGVTTYSEGIFMGYRWYDRRQIEPLFPFGFGGTYARFEYGPVTVGATSEGGLDAAFDLANAGTLDADEVPQLYLGPPQRPPAGVEFASRALAAFDRVHLGAGETRRVHLHVPPRALEYWSSSGRRWVRAAQGRTVWIGASSRDLRREAPVPGR